MAKIIGSKLDPNWLNIRKLGSSDTATALGLNPYKTPFKLWAELVGITEREDLSGKESIEWGNILEPIIGEKTAARLGKGFKPNVDIYQHDTIDYLTATPDFILDSGELLETKNTGLRQSALWGEESLPDYAHCQAIHQMIVTGVHMVYVGALIGGNNLQVRQVEYDEALANLILEKMQEFWGMVEEETPPPITADDNDFMYSIYPEESGETLILTPEYEEKIELLIRTKEQIKAYEGVKKKTEAEIKAALKNCTYGKGQTHEVSWKAQGRNSLDSKALKAAHPEIASQFTKTTTFKVLRTKEIK
jgi:putative phage-type endonuclease